MSSKGSRKRLALLDTHAIIHRAYHALPDFSTSKGEPTGALYGLISMLLKSVQDLKPTYMVACRDLAGPTHRHKKYEAYKGTRAKTDDALIVQLEKAPEIFKSFGIPMYSAPGFEADDCIGTIVHDLAPNKHIETLIVSGDMDTLQLVSDTVSVYTLRKGLNDTIVYDSDRVRERYGFGPEHVVDYKALRGDPSDNIPGIRGIGEKTAEQLITELGSIEEIYELLEKDEEILKKNGITARVIQLLKDGKKEAFFSKELATISIDAPINFTLPEKEWRLDDHIESIFKMCDELEFRSLRERVKGVVVKSAKARKEEGPSLFEAGPAEKEEVDPVVEKETGIALWLLRSDQTTPSREDILNFARTESFETARTAIFKMLAEAGALQQVYETIEKPLIPIVEKMNREGVMVDAEFLKVLSREYTAELKKIAARIYSHAGHEFNINSPKQLGDVLFDELKLSLAKQKKTATGARTTREEELAKMSDQHPIIADVLQYRELQKLLSTYIDKMIEIIDEEGKLHTEFLQTGTVTGRMGCQNPNLQNIPIRTEYGKRIREAFIAPKKHALIAIDYSQIELRIAAGLSGDERFVQVFKDGGDIHTAVASTVFGVAPENVDREMRRRAKIINFGILYGMGVNALRQNLGESVSREAAATFLSDYLANYPGLAQYLENVKKVARQTGYTETLFGRRRYFPGFKSPLPNIQAQAERMAINAPIQGTAADIIKIAMVEADHVIEKAGWRDAARLVMQVHDELVYQVDEDKAEEIARSIKEAMETVVLPEKIHGVPLIAEAKIGKNWADMDKLH